MVVQEGIPAPAQQGTVVAARELTRRYGEGDTAVDALRGIAAPCAVFTLPDA